MDRSKAEELDSRDHLARFRDRFRISDPSVMYMDGNSLGRLPKRSADLLGEAVEGQWGDGLVRSWDEWIDLPERTGASIATLIGAQPGEVVMADSTTVCLYKVLSSAARARPQGRAILVDSQEFPTDRYVAETVAHQHGWELREITSDPVEGPSPDDLASSLDGVAVVLLSHVNYRSGSMVDMEEMTALAHGAGALMVWDLSHAVGAVPIDLGACGADAAVGCSYKYLNGGPGAPAFIYVSADAQQELEQPIKGWFGAADQFEMRTAYEPAEGMRSWLSGTPPILSLIPVMVGAELVAEAGIDKLREKSLDMTEMAVELLDATERLSLGSPRDAARRGSHIAIRHPEARTICDSLIQRNVIPDFRTPDVIRFACAPLYTRFTEMWDAMQVLAELA